MTKFTVKHKSFTPYMDEQGDVQDVVGEVDIPADAMGVNTTALAASPPVVTVTWVEPVVE